MNDLKEEVIKFSQKLNSTNLSPLRSGNVSVRTTSDGIEGFLITPSGKKYETLKVEDIVFLELNKEYDFLKIFNSGLNPSSEWRFHQDIYLKKKLTSSWFSLLQQVICYEFEKIEIDFGKKTKQKPKYFKRKYWKKSVNGGGGTCAIIRNGLLFDSVGINFSEVSGKFQKKFGSQILGATKNPNYWASGISIVAHMKNPKIPAMHFNTRFVVTSKNGLEVEWMQLRASKTTVKKSCFTKKLS